MSKLCQHYKNTNSVNEQVRLLREALSSTKLISHFYFIINAESL